MIYSKTEAIVLNGFKYGDTSKIVTLYTENDGKFSAILKGARHYKSGFSGTFENLNHIEIFYSKKLSRNLQFVQKAENICSFQSIKSSLDKLTSAYKIIAITSKVTPEFDKSEDLFYLLKNILYKLENSTKNFTLIYLLFLFRLSAIIGLYFDFFRNYDYNIFVKDDMKQIESNIVFNNEQLSFINEAIRSQDFENISEDLVMQDQIADAFEEYILNFTENFGVQHSNRVLNEIKNGKLY